MKHLKGKQFTFQGISSRDVQKESDVKNMILEQENQFPENYGGEKLKSSKIKINNFAYTQAQPAGKWIVVAHWELT